MYREWKICLVAMMAFGATNVWAEEDGSYTNFDAIVNELKADADDTPAPLKDDLDWEEVALNGGIAAAASFISLNAPNGANGSGMLKGIEIFGGANLFSKSAKAEIAFRSFAPEDFGKVHMDLRELEARLMFLPYLRNSTNLRMGMGLTMRYMDVDARAAGLTEHYEAQTPATALILGFEHKVSRAVTVGPDVAYRSALNDTFDKSAWDAAIRLNASF